MSKIKTINHLQNALDEEFSWRLKEIASLKIVVKKSGYLNDLTAVRASIPLLYGHWEGFVKNAATYYLQFVNCQGLKYSELTSCFIVFGIRARHDVERARGRQALAGAAANASCRKVIVDVVSVCCFDTHGGRRTAEADRACRVMRGHFGDRMAKMFPEHSDTIEKQNKRVCHVKKF